MPSKTGGDIRRLRPLIQGQTLVAVYIVANKLNDMLNMERAMPSKTPKQAAAMRAAAAGKSSRGIPKKVGVEFVKADKAKATRKK